MWYRSWGQVSQSALRPPRGGQERQLLAVSGPGREPTAIYSHLDDGALQDATGRHRPRDEIQGDATGFIGRD